MLVRNEIVHDHGGENVRDSLHARRFPRPGPRRRQVKRRSRGGPMAVGAERALSPTDVAAAVRRGILAGDLVAGQRLVEAELTESLGASRGAVRAALIDLTHE